MSKINRNPDDQVFRKQRECMKCNSESNLSTFRFRNRILTLCTDCRREVLGDA